MEHLIMLEAAYVCVVQGWGCNTETLYLDSFRNILHKTTQNEIYNGIRQPYPTCGMTWVW
jgi:hypothetical protein